MSQFRNRARPGPRVRRLLCCVALAAAAAGLQPAAPRAAAAAPPRATCPLGSHAMRQPVDAPLSDRFRLPDGPFRAGNRGLEYATAPGTTVRAVASGVVSFAGVIAGERYVSVRHADGLVASYSYLLDVFVVRGEAVAAGSTVGTTTGRFQLGVRRDGVYIDPEPLLGGRPSRARLVPDATPAPVC